MARSSASLGTEGGLRGKTSLTSEGVRTKASLVTESDTTEGVYEDDVYEDDVYQTGDILLDLRDKSSLASEN